MAKSSLSGGSSRSSMTVFTPAFAVQLVISISTTVMVVLWQNQIFLASNSIFPPSGSSPDSWTPEVVVATTTTAEVNRTLKLPEPARIPVATYVESSNASYSIDMSNLLSIPRGEPPNLPSILVQEKDVDKQRQIYGGEGDKKHLGGFTDIDLHGVSPNAWRNMVTEFNVKSVLDVGCGRGISTLWFQLHGLDARCVEGSHDGVMKSVLPDAEKQVVEHDFARGPWWPAKTYDAVWAVEFLEHVGVNYHFNYVAAFRKAALLFLTSSRWGGWHHVEVHMDPWWIRKFESYGFRYDEKLTAQVKKWVYDEQRTKKVAPNGKGYYAQHLAMSLKVFINPSVASLPEHAHLFFEHGCFGGRKEGVGVGQDPIRHRECGTNQRNAFLETPLDKAYQPLKLTDAMQATWEAEIRKRITVEQPKK